MQLDAMKHQGQKNTSCQVGTKLRSDTILAENNSDSARQIQRYIRLTKLITPILELIDNAKMAFMVGVNLSYLTVDNQETLFNYITEYKKRISLDQSEKLRTLNSIGEFTDNNLDNFFNVAKKATLPKSSYKIKADYVEKIMFCVNETKDKLGPEIYQELLKIFR